MTSNIAKIRAALELANRGGKLYAMNGLRQKSSEALAALAELEMAAAEPVGKVESSPFGPIPAVDVSKLKCGMKLYAAPPAPPAKPAKPALGMPEWYGMDTPWPLHDVLSKLIEATGILLDRHSYDGHGHEGLRYAQLAGKEILANILKERTP